MDASSEIHTIINRDTKSIFYIGSLENCNIRCNQANAIYDNTKFIVVPHKANDYVATLIQRQNKSDGFKRNTIMRVALPQRCTSPPKLIPEATIKERVQDYLKKF
jgi:hypothetical protein